MSYYNTETQKEYSHIPAEWQGTRPYPSATHLHHEHGWREVIPFEVPAGYVKNGNRRIEMIDDEAHEVFDVITEAEAQAEWDASEEYASRAYANQIIGNIQAKLAEIGVTPSDKLQVVQAVDAWVQAADEGSAERQNRLETASRLNVWYAMLEKVCEQIGIEPDGLIAGTKTISMEMP